MDAIKDLLIEFWFLAIAFLALALVLLIVVIILAVKLKRAKCRAAQEDEDAEPQRVAPAPATSAAEENTAATTIIAPVTAADEDDDDSLEVIEREDNIEVKDKSGEGYVVAYDSSKGDWTIRKKGAERATRRVATKEEAMKIAKELSRKHNVALIVKKKDGRFQKQW